MFRFFVLQVLAMLLMLSAPVAVGAGIVFGAVQVFNLLGFLLLALAFCVFRRAEDIL